MGARQDVEDLLGLQTGDAHIIRNAGGVATDDAIRCLIISHHPLNTNEIILIHHTRCGMLAFTADLLKAGLEGDPAAEKLFGQATGRKFVSCKKHAATPSAFHAFRGQIEPLDAPPDAKNRERLAWDVRRGMSAILYHPWIPTSGPDATMVRGFGGDAAREGHVVRIGDDHAYRYHHIFGAAPPAHDDLIVPCGPRRFVERCLHA